MDEFRIKLGFKPNDIIMTKEESITAKISKLFKKEKIRLQHKVIDYYNDLYFTEYKFVVEIDEKGHLDRKEEEEQERENKIEETSGCEFVRTNPGKESFHVFDEIGRIYESINEIKEKRKNESIDIMKRKCKKYVDKIKKETMKQ